MVEMYLGLGSNLGESATLIKEAVEALKKSSGIYELVASSLYETEPVGYLDQPRFVNCVVRAKTTLSAEELLKLCQKIEHEFNRVRTIRWGPRTLDVDILLYGQERISTSELEIPHPRMNERAFVLVPLDEICSEAIKNKLKLDSLISELEDQGIRKLERYETATQCYKQNS